jgi:hypothetical protein
MTFPAGFSFDSEDDFIEKFVVPLLNRLGYSLILNYHGTSEFGKDLIIGEFDRFSHVRYHGIQVKYLPSISLSATDDLIRDCHQAFKNPFRHPQTGQDHRISTFYAINGGSISDQSKTHFFASVQVDYGDNARLLDGKALIQLDRSATIIGVEPVRSVLLGLLLELRFNLQLVDDICNSLKQMIEAKGPYPIQRLSCDATSSYLQRPHGSLIQHFGVLQQYWQGTTMFNRIVDSIDGPISAGDFKKHRAEGAYRVRDQIKAVRNQVLPLVSSQLSLLGPLVSP